jgi:hypothetical protein
MKSSAAEKVRGLGLLALGALALYVVEHGPFVTHEAPLPVALSTAKLTALENQLLALQSSTADVRMLALRALAALEQKPADAQASETVSPLPSPGTEAGAQGEPTSAKGTPSAEAEDHDIQLESLFADAQARGTWSNDDREELRMLSMRAGGERAPELMQGWVRAMNEGRLVPTTDGPPF